MPKKIDDETPVTDVVIEFNGATFTIPKDTDEWPTTAWLARIEATTTGRTLDWMQFVELLLGPAQWQQLTTLTASKKGDFVKFLDVFTPTVVKECDL